MKRIFKIGLILLAALSVSGCANEEGGSSSQVRAYKTWKEAKSHRTPIKIYVDESNVYGSYEKGTDEAVVEEAVEKKFWEDTGVAIELKIQYESHATFTLKFGAVMAGGEWDAAVGYIGQAGLDETVLPQNVHLDIANLLKQYGKKVSATLDKSSINAVTNLSGQVVGIPSENITKQKGVLVRKDYMTRVGYTESQEEAEASEGKLTWCHSIKDFDTMIRKMKSQIKECTTPLSGNVYDMEFTLLAGCKYSLGYQYRDVNNLPDGTQEVVPGWISKNYGDVLQQEYDWYSDGLWEKEHQQIAENTRISNLGVGKSAVYFSNPTVTNLINVARKAKAIDTTGKAEFVLLEPLAAVDAEGKAVEDTGAFVEVSKNTDCLIFNRRSNKAKLVMQYMNWMYSKKANYELCAYGVKDKHWRDSPLGDDYYEYCQDYYLDQKPYSGVFALVHNDTISAKIPMQYSETERNWIDDCRNYNCIKNPTDGMLFFGASSTAQNGYATAENDIYQYVGEVWVGKSNPSGASGWASACTKYRSQASEYLNWLNEQYAKYVSSRS